MASTGHVGVGSIVELSNAKAAALVGADVVLVANGGLGKAFDELEMNRHVFAQEGVAVRGVVLNKVMPEKVEMVREKMGKLLRERWAVLLHFSASVHSAYARRSPVAERGVLLCFLVIDVL